MILPKGTGKDIKNNSLESQDIDSSAVGTSEIKDGTIEVRDLSSGAIDALTDGSEFVGANWGTILRNTLGDGSADLRQGPYATNVGQNLKPALGNGSLQLTTGTTPASGGNQNKIAFGNEVDFTGMKLSDISQVGFSIFTTKENVDRGVGNLPSISFEIDPKDENIKKDGNRVTYSSLVFIPTGNANQAGKWTPFSATDGTWFLTNGATATAVGCGSICTFDQVKQQLPNATIHSLQITKGRDAEFQGAVDALRVNGSVYDFEVNGVVKRNA